MKSAGLIPYSPYSHGAKKMSELLGIPLLLRDYFRRYSHHEGYDAHRNKIGPLETVINWGVGGDLYCPGVPVINPSKEVAKCVSKVDFFSAISKSKHGARVPPWTTNHKEALEWAQEGRVVMARRDAEGRGGRGILFYDEDNLSDWLNSPLFVEWIINLYEYRAHCAFGKIIYWQKKAVATIDKFGNPVDTTNIDRRVRSHKNGFYFMSDGDFTVPGEVLDQATKTIASLPNMHFFALDIIWNKHYNKAYVLEANTAMGIDEGQTAEKYAEAFREYLA